MKARIYTAGILSTLIATGMPTIVLPAVSAPSQVSAAKTHTDTTETAPSFADELDDLDLTSFEQDEKPQPPAAWQLMLMRWGGTLLFTSFSVYDYCVHKIAAVRRYITRSFSSPRAYRYE